MLFQHVESKKFTNPQLLVQEGTLTGMLKGYNDMQVNRTVEEMLQTCRESSVFVAQLDFG